MAAMKLYVRTLHCNARTSATDKRYLFFWSLQLIERK